MRIRSPATTGNITWVGNVLEQLSTFTCLGRPYHHHRLHWGSCWGQVEEGTGCILHFETHMEIKFHLTVDKDKDLQFQREVRPPIRIWDLEIDKEDHLPTSDVYQSQTPVHLGSLVAQKDFEWGAVAAYKARENCSHPPEEGRRKWPWIGHTLSKPATNITHLSHKWNPQGVRRKGRPKKSWRRKTQQEY